ncbi:MAG: cytochrome d ubiquinol oxidase subunit II [Actinobacteria bacterium]|nr:cytochrome d ubiquinol oxidase subunit II [Actinomycetota bacterium]
MTVAEILLGVMWVGVTLYAVFAGADFGAGFWDLVAGGARSGAPARQRIETSIGPVWEANHVWLIFVLVILWTGFPAAFAAIASTLYVPLTAAGVGIILRGAGFALRKPVHEVGLQRTFGAAFAASSVVTPFFFGAVAGAVASGRVPAAPDESGGIDPWTAWTGPTSLLGGSLAVATCAYLGATFLAADAHRDGERDLAARYQRSGIAAAVAAGLLSLGGILVLRADAPELYAGLTGRAIPLVVGSAVAGVASLALLFRRDYVRARAAAVVAVVAVVWGWAAGQYPALLVGELSIAGGAGARTTLIAVLVSLGIGALLFVPPLAVLLSLHARGRLGPATGGQAATHHE